MYNKYRLSSGAFEREKEEEKVDVEKEYGDKLEIIKENPKVSLNHTFVSKEVSEKACHGKSGINFKKNYMPLRQRSV